MLSDTNRYRFAYDPFTLTETERESDIASRYVLRESNLLLA